MIVELVESILQVHERKRDPFSIQQVDAALRETLFAVLQSTANRAIADDPAPDMPLLACGPPKKNDEGAE